MGGAAAPLAAVQAAAPQAGAEDKGPAQTARSGPFRPGQMSELAIDRTDKGPQQHNFTELYDHFLFPLRDEPLRLFEIGIDQGGSLLLWQDYFPRATIHAIDIDKRSRHDNERVKTFVGDQAKRERLAKVMAETGGDYDLILDDGGHEMHQQQISLAFLFPFVKPGGYYILEDVHTSLREIWPDFGADPDETNTTLRMIDRFIRTGKIESQFMEPAEREYLAANIEFCNLFFRNNAEHSMTAVFKKRVPK
jgi:hypothetical protein